MAENPKLGEEVDELNRVVFDNVVHSLDLTKDENLELL